MFLAWKHIEKDSLTTGFPEWHTPLLLCSISLPRTSTAREIAVTQTRDQADAPDFADIVAAEWRDRFPDEQIDSVPAVMRVLRWAQDTELAVNDALKPFDIGRGGVEVMCAVVRSHNHRLAPKDVMKRMVVSSGGLTARIDKLEAKGLLRRVPDPEDRRSFLLEATPEGVEIAKAAHARHVAVVREKIRALDAAELEMLDQLAKKLLSPVA